VTGLFALGETNGVFEKGTSLDAPFPCTYGDCEGQINIESWKARTDAGDPTSPEDPLVRQIRRGLTEFRGAYYQDEGWKAQQDGRKVAVFSIQGWTDDLFTAVESFRMFKYLKRLDSLWPVEVALGDVGHSRAQNRPDTWHKLNNDAFQWLQSHIDGSHEERTGVTSEATVCGDADPPQQASGRTPEGLANRTILFRLPPGNTVSPLGAADRTGRRPTRSSVPRSSRARPAASPTGPPWAATPRTRRRFPARRRTSASGTSECLTCGRGRRPACSPRASSTWRPTGPSCWLETSRRPASCACPSTAITGGSSRATASVST
jgi:hypothetical protein